MSILGPESHLALSAVNRGALHFRGVSAEDIGAFVKKRTGFVKGKRVSGGCRLKNQGPETERGCAGKISYHQTFPRTKAAF